MSRNYTQLEFVKEIVYFIEDEENIQDIKCRFYIDYNFKGIMLNLYYNKYRLRININDYSQDSLQMVFLFILKTIKGEDDISYIEKISTIRYYFETTLIYLDVLIFGSKIQKDQYRI